MNGKVDMGIIGAVIVTYNRLNDLKRVLAAYDGMKEYPSFVVVVDNASNNETKVYLDEWASCQASFRKIVLTMSTNLGGSGGFKVGIARALTEGADWVFVADDDAVPDSEVFNNLKKGFSIFRQDFPNQNVSALCCSVVTSNGIDLAHRRRVTKQLLRIKETAVGLDEYLNSYFKCDELSYVGSLISADAIREIGETNDQFFIFHDDTDHSLRLRKYGAIVCIPKAEIYHKVTNYNGVHDTWRDYYDARNHLVLIKMNYSYPVFLFQAFDFYIRRCSFVAYIVRHRSKLERYIASAALSDAMHGRLGVSKDFRVGQPVTYREGR